MKKDSLWNEIQSNPLAKRDLWHSWEWNRIYYYLVNDQRQLDPGNPHNFQIDGNDGNQYTLRMPADRKFWSTGVNQNHVSNDQQALKMLQQRAQSFNYPIGDYPDVLDAAYNDVNNRIENVHGFLKAGLFELDYRDNGRQSDLRKPNETDSYWWPTYTGDILNFEQKAYKSIPSAPKNDNILGEWDLNSKQREAFMWLVGSPGLRAI